MTSLFKRTIGKGAHDLVLLHGWGLNAEVWHCITGRLMPHFRLHLIDLPGYGRSQKFGALTLQQMVDIVMDNVPQRAVWLGWSMGGLVASSAALDYPECVQALITVSSSPCFVERPQEGWPGIRASVLRGFERQLSEDFLRTVYRFIELQTLGAPAAQADVRLLQQAISSSPVPEVKTLNSGLALLAENDIRSSMNGLSMPGLRIYGSQDGLVPKQVVPLVDKLWPRSVSRIIPHAAHAPFMSHPEVFCDELRAFIERALQGTSGG